MANDKPNEIELVSNGNNMNNKVNRGNLFDGNRQLGNSEQNSDDDDVEKVRERNRDLQFIVGKLQKQLENLTEEVKKLNEIISSQQKEKEKLFEMIQQLKSPKKSPKKSPARKKVKVSHTRKTTQTEQTPTEQHATNTNTAIENGNASERDNNMSQMSAMMPENTHTNTQPSGSAESNGHNDNIEMKEPNADALSEESSSEEEDGDSDSDVETVENKTTQQAKRSPRIPPVDIWTHDRANIQKAIQSNLPKDSCLFGRVNNGKFRVFPKDAATRADLIKFIEGKNIGYNTYTPSAEKMINVLIKGLDHIDDANVIEEELANKGFTPHKIQKHVTGYMRKNNIKSSLWHIVLLPNTDTKELFGIKVIDNAIVKFEFLRKPKVIQCRRCQRFNHSASNCSLPYRCVKCTESHEPGKCKSETSGNKFKPKCVNCQGNHTANDAANCAIFKRAIELKTNKQNEPSKKSESKPASTQSSIRTSQTFAERTKTNQKRQHQRKKSGNNSVDDFVNKQNKMISDFVATIQKMQQQFVSSFDRRNGQ